MQPMAVALKIATLEVGTSTTITVQAIKIMGQERRILATIISVRLPRLNLKGHCCPQQFCDNHSSPFNYDYSIAKLLSC